MGSMMDAATFLALLFAALSPHERIEVRPINARGMVGPRRWCATPQAAADYAASLAGRWNVYAGVNPRRQGGGKKPDVTSLGALHADLDDKRYPDGRAGVLAALAAFPLRPSLLVDSGGGLQAYWLLARRLSLAGPDRWATIARAEGILRRLYAALGGLDAVQDVSRVLRVPGSTNLKYTPPRPVEVLDATEARYTLDDFEELLPAPVRAPRPAPDFRGGARVHRPGVPAPEEVREMLRYIPARGDYKHHWVTVLAAVHSAYPDATGIALCEEWSPGYRGEIERKFRSFGRYTGQHGPATIGTLIWLAKRHGWRPPARRVVWLPPKEAAHAR